MWDPKLVEGAERFLAEEALRWSAAEKESAEARERFRDAVRTAHGSGMSEYRIASVAGVTRKTVRTWVGK